MKNKIISILIAGILVMCTSLPVYAVETNSTSYISSFVTKIQELSQDYNVADVTCNTSEIYNSVTKSKELMNEILTFIKLNTDQQFYIKIETEQESLLKAEEQIIKSIEDEYSANGGGSGCGRDCARNESKFNINRCNSLIKSYKEYKNIVILTPPTLSNTNVGWRLINEKYYYVAPDGQLVTNGIIGGGNNDYFVNSDGTWGGNYYLTSVVKYNEYTNEATIYVDENYITFKANDLQLGSGCLVTVDINGNVIKHSYRSDHNSNLYKDSYYSLWDEVNEYEK